jgi:hypothetical protein
VRRKGESEQEDQKIRRVCLLIFSTFAFAFALTGCQTHACDSSTVTVDDTDGGPVPLHYVQGGIVWESAPSDGPWLDFPGNATITFHFPRGFRNPTYCLPYVSTDPYQEAGAGTYSVASGELAQFTSQAPDYFAVTNNSCAEYYLRIVCTESLDAGPPPPASDASRD